MGLLISLIGNTVRRHLPDPIRRRRFRNAARRLVPGPHWYDDEIQPDEVARAVLLRLLYLQRRARVVTRFRQYEAAALFARASIEGCIAGLYYLHAADTNGEFRGASRQMFKKMIDDISADSFGNEFLDELLEPFGQSNLPNIKDRVDRILKSGGPQVASLLYEHYYGPLSELYEHAGPAAIFRHANVRTSAPREQPYKVWSGCSASHTTDTMAAVVAMAIVGRDHPDFALFEGYAGYHWRLVTLPRLRPMFGMFLFRVDPRHLPKVIFELRRIRAAASAGHKITDDDMDRLSPLLGKLLRSNPDDPIALEVDRRLRSVLVSAPALVEDSIYSPSIDGDVASTNHPVS